MEQSLRADVIKIALDMLSTGLNKGKTGNVSARVDGGFLITPSGVDYAALGPADIALMNMNGDSVGPLKPSSEWRFHRDIYLNRADVGAVVHAHSPFCTALACVAMAIPAFHYMVAVAGGRDIRCAPYATFGTQALSDRAVIALDGRKACLLANHGMIAVGGTLAQALAVASEVESLAEQYWRALQIGRPIILEDDEMDLVLEKFKSYGESAQK
ncbi:L-fuculose 1-phosphate aldolase [Varunaivibrio sulfuroxidans]|uniref:L-fuculose 1-phosphate aldolase n=2 Tax=Varunaivibrio sulfuroxidans TaxID=1773489 RepID=A0A4R3J6C6_9PROT|nr:L-fuculose 1-phosphate aldolase [Varunaivibrio sulfuroxidans]